MVILFKALPPETGFEESFGSGSSNGNLPLLHQKWNHNAVAGTSGIDGM